MVKPRAPGLGDEASNKVAQLRDIITRLRAQVAAADKLAEAIAARYAEEKRICEPMAMASLSHLGDCRKAERDALAAYLRAKRPAESKFPTASGFPDP